MIVIPCFPLRLFCALSVSLALTCLALGADGNDGDKSNSGRTASNTFVSAVQLTNSNESVAHFVARSQLSAVLPAIGDFAELLSLGVSAKKLEHSPQKVEALKPVVGTTKSATTGMQMARSSNKQSGQSDAEVGSLPGVDVISAIADPESLAVPDNFMYVRFSKSFLESYICRQYERKSPVYDNILGAAVRGNSHTTARTELDLIDNPSEAQARLRFKGVTRFNTVSYSGPISIFSQGITGFVSEKRLWFDGMSIQQSEPQTAAEASTTTTGFSTSLPRLRGRISLRIAERREAEDHRLAEEISAQRTSEKVSQAFNSVVKDRTNAFTNELKSDYARLPLEGRFAIADIRCSTLNNRLQIMVLGHGTQEPTYVPEPPMLADYPDIEVHLHTALVQKAILDPALRSTLEAAVERLVNRPLISVVNAPVANQQPNPPRDLKIRWTGGEGSQWLTLAWHGADKNTVARATGSPAESP